jgi:hypothetical protein
VSRTRSGTIDTNDDGGDPDADTRPIPAPAPNVTATAAPIAAQRDLTNPERSDISHTSMITHRTPRTAHRPPNHDNTRHVVSNRYSMLVTGAPIPGAT